MHTVTVVHACMWTYIVSMAHVQHVYIHDSTLLVLAVVIVWENLDKLVFLNFGRNNLTGT